MPLKRKEENNMGMGRMPRNLPKGYEKSKRINGKVVKRLLSYVTGTYKFSFIIVLVCIVISTLAGVAGSLFIQRLIDDYITPLIGQTNPSFIPLANAILTMAGIYLIGVIATFVYNTVMVTIGQGILKRIRDDMFAHTQTLPIKYFDTHNFGDVMSRYTNDTDSLRQMISQSIPTLFSSIVTIVAVFAAMLVTSIHLTLLVLVMLAVMWTVSKRIGGKSADYFIKQQRALGTVNGFVEEMINGQKVVKVFCHEKVNEQQFDEINTDLCHYATEANKFANIFGPIIGNLGDLQYVLIAIAGGAMAISGFGSLTLGAIASFLQLSRSFTMPINQIAQQLNSVVMSLAGAERIFELLDEESEKDEGYVTLINIKEENGELVETKEKTNTWGWKHPHSDGTTTITRLTGDVRFFDVDFAYEEGKPVLHDISLFAKPGQKVAFVGATGAGKTTITNLLNRFYDLADGKIRYDGININKIKKPDLRRSLGIVLQDTNLFTGTVMENIRYGNLEATDEEVTEAAKLANADDFITRLPQGYQTLLTSDGANLSQGQRQLLSIARVAVANPPVMVLDEATSSIDTRTEALVQNGMDRLMKGRTVFVIAHRLSTVQNSDAIMVLEHGKIIERGNHQQLLEQKGKYYQLYTGAFELE
jgi:ATP-binding cassette subfamily B protein